MLNLPHCGKIDFTKILPQIVWEQISTLYFLLYEIAKPASIFQKSAKSWGTRFHGTFVTLWSHLSACQMGQLFAKIGSGQLPPNYPSIWKCYLKIIIIIIISMWINQVINLGLISITNIIPMLGTILTTIRIMR